MFDPIQKMIDQQANTVNPDQTALSDIELLNWWMQFIYRGVEIAILYTCPVKSKCPKDILLVPKGHIIH